MQQNYAMLSGVIPGSELYWGVDGNARRANPVIADLCLTVTECVMVLLTGSTLKHRDALPASPPS